MPNLRKGYKNPLAVSKTARSLLVKDLAPAPFHPATPRKGAKRWLVPGASELPAQDRQPGDRNAEHGEGHTTIGDRGTNGEPVPVFLGRGGPTDGRKRSVELNGSVAINAFQAAATEVIEGAEIAGGGLESAPPPRASSAPAAGPRAVKIKTAGNSAEVLGFFTRQRARDCSPTSLSGPPVCRKALHFATLVGEQLWFCKND